MTHPRAEALDALSHLACKLKAAAALLTTEAAQLGEDEVFGLHLFFTAAAREITRAQAKLAKLIPAD